MDGRRQRGSDEEHQVPEPVRQTPGEMGSGKRDIKDFQDELEGKEITEYNANEIVRQFLSKKANIETVVGEMYEELSKLENDIEKHLDNEKYRDEGYVREMTQEKTKDALDTTKSILQWRELQIKVMMTIIVKQNRLITQLKGADLSREVLEEMQEVFDQKFESDKEKLNVMKETMEERIQNVKENLEERINEIEKRERETLTQTAGQLGELNSILEQIEEQIDGELQKPEVSEDLTRSVEQKTDTEVPEDMKPEDYEPEPEEPDEEEEETEEEGRQVPEDWDDIEKEHVQPVPRPAYGYTHELEPIPESVYDEDEHDYYITDTEWKVLHSIDRGLEGKQEIRDDWDTGAMAIPMQQINNMVKRGLIDPDRLPENLAEQVKVEEPNE